MDIDSNDLKRLAKNYLEENYGVKVDAKAHAPAGADPERARAAQHHTARSGRGPESAACHAVG